MLSFDILSGFYSLNAVPGCQQLLLRSGGNERNTTQYEVRGVMRVGLQNVLWCGNVKNLVWSGGNGREVFWMTSIRVFPLNKFPKPRAVFWEANALIGVMWRMVDF